ncbi:MULTISPECIES: SIR2 family protein [Nocardiaceae]|uniref:NAD-dependent SIR2 family protein deacetylase n=1 Tax=Rhodococcoides corynebacterioides TaxID=53972 RepID=A0ABS2KWD1_9NOCA|nr:MULTISPECIES: SIR2 family protein [Rhodococcus]MBM7416259.1 NAD-dependent SIR2 family protein deacetylase [Rhodococcus corynebacterioides]MBP1114512.1 NAD-dependent SIR2 family protein deacetylase [Rhodococcus sp. PvP016]
MLAMAMHAQPGVYALLLGSGISTSAGIPTGWGVVKSLVSKLAAAEDPDDAQSHALAASDPEAWWSAHADGELGYSSLLAEAAPSASTRQGLLREYFVATDREREEGNKVPGPAHTAVAELAKRGTVRVILTTNFDRLIEQALDAEGVQAQVISRADAVKGMTPLTHAAVTVIKLHGDYTELDTRNTLDELTTYPKEWTELLRQVFTEFGLVISGWSGEWDKALVAALESAPRRYPLYWDSRSSNGPGARQLLTALHGHRMPAETAEQLFSDLAGSIDALDRLAEPQLTTAMAIARLKRYLPNPVLRIDLHDLVMSKVDDVATAVRSLPFRSNVLTVDDLDGHFTELLAATTPLLRLLIAGVYHDDEGAHTRLWVDILQRLLDLRQTFTGPTALLPLQHYPALLALQSMNIVAVERSRDGLFTELLTAPRWADIGRDPSPAFDVLHMGQVLDDGTVLVLPRWNGHRWSYPPSHMLRNDLEAVFADHLPSGEQFRRLMDDVEYRTGFVQHFLRVPDLGMWHANSGEFVGDRNQRRDGSLPAETRFREHIERHGKGVWGTMTATGILTDSEFDSYRAVLKQYVRFG